MIFHEAGKKTEKAGKPQIRFVGFVDEWEQCKLGEIYQRIRNAFVGTVTPYYVDDGHFYLESNNVKDGQINRYSEIFINDEFYEKQKDNWLHTGDLVMVQSGHVGHTAVIPENLDNTAAHALIIISNATKKTCPFFLNYQFQAPRTKTDIDNITTGNTIKHILASEIKKFRIQVPIYNEQKKLGKYFENLENLITLCQHKYNKLVDVKKSMCEKMFPKDGETVPEICFKGFSDAWEQRKFSELVLIERGGSPRPIDDYITDQPNGLNWVKIGDAPTQGHHITKTAEKIKLEGLSKTRQVQPGDLILSNSMSFGKPYIMAINGCIHDGWLLIRDINNIFDLTFLCHLLGTTQMLEQYKQFATGSTVNNLNKELVGNTIVTIPSKQEQRVLGEYFEQLDHLITLHQRKLEKLKNLKKAFLEKMFI